MILFMFIFFVTCAVKCDNNYYVIQMPEDLPNNKVPLNQPPFEVFWNVPTMQCASKQVAFRDLNKKFGIIQNQGDSFRGDRISILYDPGIFPAIFKNDTSGKLRFRNGGVPQEGDLEKHLEAFRDILNQSIPDQDFHGIGIIDFESWRPIYRQNFGVLSPYKDVSYEIERNNHWWWPQGMVAAEAKRRFEESARTFMESTLIVAKKLRPLATWGYYGFPYCFNSNSSRCADKVPSENDHISWLWTESTALYPSVYSSKDLTPDQLAQFIKGRVDEAARAKRGAKGDVSILPYFWFRYRDGGYMSQDDLETVLKTFDNSDANGFIIWGASSDVNTIDKCVKLLNYVDNILGPAIAKYTMPKRNVNGVSDDFHGVTDNINATEPDHSVASEIYDVVDSGDVNNKSEVFSNVSGYNYTKDSSNESANETKISNFEVSNYNKEIDGSKTNDSDTLILSNTAQIDHSSKPQNISSFSLYSAVDSVILDRIAEKVLTTNSPVELTTEKVNKVEFDELDEEYNWVPPENYTEDIVEYVEEELAKKQNQQNTSYGDESKPNSEEHKLSKAPMDLILILNKLTSLFNSTEYKNKVEKNLQINNKTVYKETEKVSQNEKSGHHCKHCMDKMKDMKKGCKKIMHKHMEKESDNGHSGESSHQTHDEKSQFLDEISTEQHLSKVSVQNKTENYIIPTLIEKLYEENDTIVSVNDESQSQYTTKQTPIISDDINPKINQSRIDNQENIVINDMMFPVEDNAITTTDNYLDVNITAFEIENVANELINRTIDVNIPNSITKSTEISQKPKDKTVSTEKTIDLSEDFFDIAKITLPSSETTVSTITESITTEYTTENDSTTSKVEISTMPVNISILKDPITIDKEVQNASTTEITTNVVKSKETNELPAKLNITKEIATNKMTKNEKKGKPIHLSSSVIESVTTIQNEETEEQHSPKNMKKGLPKSKDTYENIIKQDLPILEEPVSSNSAMKKVARAAASTTSKAYLCVLVIFLPCLNFL